MRGRIGQWRETMLSLRIGPVRSLKFLHQAFQNMLMSLCYLYGSVLLVASIASRRSICHALKFLDKSHSCLQEERLRPISCTSRLALSSAIDRYAVAHLVGWTFKGIIHPRRSTLWIASIGFEFAEYLASRQIPFLTECWWDSVILDVGICNALGIELGILLAPHRHRRRLENRAVWLREWVIIAAMIVTDLNFFLFRDVLKLGMKSPLQAIRTGFLTILGLPASAQVLQTGDQNYWNKRFAIAYWTLLALEALQWFRH